LVASSDLLKIVHYINSSFAILKKLIILNSSFQAIEVAHVMITDVFREVLHNYEHVIAQTINIRHFANYQLTQLISGNIVFYFMWGLMKKPSSKECKLLSDHKC
jgi:hypothetical protein